MPALNPTNPADRPTDWQAEIIALFRGNPALQEHISQRASPNGPILSISRPIRVEDRACLECHSTPQAAPAAMVDLYGPSNGFGWEMGKPWARRSSRCRCRWRCSARQAPSAP
ncbi:DUF3365 domain-containing protein [Pseudoroseomonas wenyumeiae]